MRLLLFALRFLEALGLCRRFSLLLRVVVGQLLGWAGEEEEEEAEYEEEAEETHMH